MKNKSQISELIKNKAKKLGFSSVGISKANYLEKESKQLREWLDKDFHGEMQYMENHFEKRIDPRKLVEGAKSVISVLFNYYPKEKQIKNTYKISKYAYGRDYHYVLKEKLFTLFEYINSEIGEISGRVFVDSAPVMDKVWAAKSGLGWIGKNTNLISKELGSFQFIGELIIDLELEYDHPVKDYCGNCTNCIDACPTNALSPYQLDARKCISYLTIEKKGDIPKEFNDKLNDWIFGCDICQDVCPWNQPACLPTRQVRQAGSKAKPHNEPQFKITEDLQRLNKEDWRELNKEVFKKLSKNSPIERIKFEKFKKNIENLK